MPELRRRARGAQVQAPLPEPRVRLLHELFGLLLTIASTPLGVCLRHHRAARGQRSTARLTPRSALAPAARAASLGYFGRLRSPRTDVRVPLIVRGVRSSGD